MKIQMYSQITRKLWYICGSCGVYNFICYMHLFFVFFFINLYVNAKYICNIFFKDVVWILSINTYISIYMHLSTLVCFMESIPWIFCLYFVRCFLGFWTRQIWGIWKLRPAYSPETPNLGQNRWCFVPCDLEIWWMTLENNNASLFCCFKLCATFHSHWWI